MPAQFQTYPQMSWADHVKMIRREWVQGDHLLIAAPTKAGKTTLAAQLLPIRSHAVMLVTKLQDPTFAKEFKGWKRYTDWPKRNPPAWDNRILLWPKPGKTMAETRAIQKDVMSRALDAIAREGKRCVCVDEAIYMCEPKFLNLSTEIGMLHYFGRSSGISMVTLAQRPAWVPKILYGSVTHAYIARTRDAEDKKRLSDLGGIDAKELGFNVSSLPTRHDYVYVNPQGDEAPAVVNTRQ